MIRQPIPEKYAELTGVPFRALSCSILAEVRDSYRLDGFVSVSDLSSLRTGDTSPTHVELPTSTGGKKTFTLHNLNTPWIRLVNPAIEDITFRLGYLSKTTLQMIKNCKESIEAAGEKQAWVFADPVLEYAIDREAEYFRYMLPSLVLPLKVIKDETRLDQTAEKSKLAS